MTRSISALNVASSRIGNCHRRHRQPNNDRQRIARNFITFSTEFDDFRGLHGLIVKAFMISIVASFITSIARDIFCDRTAWDRKVVQTVRPVTGSPDVSRNASDANGGTI